jgi:hypothetical protein
LEKDAVDAGPFHSITCTSASPGSTRGCDGGMRG